MQLDLVAALRRGLAGRYDMAGELGRGGMAVVCRARDLRHDRDVAVKVLYPDLARAVGGERFLREIAILARLSHPNILPLLDSGSVEVLPGLEVPWYAMPLVQDETLRARLQREGPLPVDQAIGYTRDLCAALQHAHEQGFIHRDIKPENILLSGGQAVLADFGIARAVTVAGGGTLSSTGIVVGTPAYMSPEQSVGSPRLDGRSDLYSVGVVLYEMLAGHPPFTGATPQAISARHQFEPPPPITVVRPGLPEGLAGALERSLAKLAADRFQTADELAHALQHAPQTSKSRAGARAGGRWWLMAGVVAALGAAWWALSPGIIGGIRLDPQRFVVLPFDVQTPLPIPIGGQEAEDMVSDALTRWTDVGVVSSLTVTDALLRNAGPLTLKRALAVARATGAGRLVWGRISGARDSTRVAGVVYDVSDGREVRTGTVWLPEEIGIGTLAAKFAELTYALVLPGRPTPEDAADATGAKSIAAYVSYAAGDSALDRWNLELARKRYREALTLDPEYPNANLQLALVGNWLEESPQEWRGYAERAVRSGDRLTRSKRVAAEGLLSLANSRYPEACQRFRQLIRMDSLDFRGWFGLGECLTRDSVVVPDTTSPSQWSFRSSYAAGIRAYTHALTLVPASHLAYGGAALRRLATRLMTEPDVLRLGTPAESTSRVFVAYPSLSGDTLSFVPLPATDILATAHVPATWPAALQADREQLVRITTVWLDQFPQSRVALVSHAEALEMIGVLEGPARSALGLVRALRAGVTASADPGLAIRNIRLLVKARKYTAARALAESLLAVRPNSMEEGVSQAGVAALIGRADRAAELQAQYAELPFASSAVEILSLPGEVRRQANRLLVYAGAGEPEDSIRTIAARVRRLVAQDLPPAERGRALDAALFRPTLLAFPVLGTRTAPGFRLTEVEAQLARGQGDSARMILDELSHLVLPEAQAAAPPDFALLEARLWMLAGDTARAVHRLEVALSNPGHLSTDVLTDPSQAAALGRQLALYHRLRPDGPLAPDTALTALWGRRH